MVPVRHELVASHEKIKLLEALLAKIGDRVQVCEIYANIEAGDSQQWCKVL